MVWWRLGHDPNALDLSRRFESSSLASPLGTDELGRDLFSRVVAGGVVTIGAASIALAATSVIGTLIDTRPLVLGEARPQARTSHLHGFARRHTRGRVRVDHGLDLWNQPECSDPCRHRGWMARDSESSRCIIFNQRPEVMVTG